MFGLLPYNCAFLTNVAHFSRLALSWVVYVRCLAFSFLPNLCSIPAVFLALSCHTVVFLGQLIFASWHLYTGSWRSSHLPFFILQALDRSSLAVLLAEPGDLGFGLWLIFVRVALFPLAYLYGCSWPFSRSDYASRCCCPWTLLASLVVPLVVLCLLQEVITPRDDVAPGLRWHLLSFLWLLLAFYKK